MQKKIRRSTREDEVNGQWCKVRRLSAQCFNLCSLLLTG
uniref:Uncharacterized protein n=1 Tax=Arundo donax TaxID=35708 RepID=A0A0A9D669_ARUDO